jgi:hypothetical protein
MVAMQVTDKNLETMICFDPVPVDLHLSAFATINNKLTFTGMKHL